jgi:hypothetical protein
MWQRGSGNIGSAVPCITSVGTEMSASRNGIASPARTQWFVTLAARSRVRSTTRSALWRARSSSYPRVPAYGRSISTR